MTSSTIVVFIFLMSLGALDGIFGMDPRDEPTGKWYVVAVGNFNTLPVPKCWTIEMSEPSNYFYFTGNLTAYHNETSERHHMYLNGIRYGIAGNPLIREQFFSVLGTYGANEHILISSISFVNFANDTSGVRLIKFLKKEQFSYFDKLYVSRDPQLPSDYDAGDAMRLNNLDCPQDEVVTLPTQEK